ncbi:MAG: NUDIX hydrolase [Asticcacaulis sp.]
MQGPIPAVGVVCLRSGASGPEVLLIRRANPPKAGSWSIPGGRIQPGEAVAAAALRELTEETGVSARLIGLLDVVDGLFADETGAGGYHYVLIDYLAHWIGGEPLAGDDASEAVFVPIDLALARLDWDKTRALISLALDRWTTRKG